MTTLAESSPETSDTETAFADVFEGPEKKLEVYFSRGDDSSGLRRFQHDVWSDMLADAACTILHQESNKDFDAYLLSESSMFVYPDRLILKTCGTTTLLLALPKLFALADKVGCIVEHVLYSHLRYKFPEQQIYPHNSFQQEQEYLSRHLGNAQARVLGPPDGRCWYVLHASGPPPVPDALGAPDGDAAQPQGPGDDLFEIAMEGLSEEVCARFFKAAHPEMKGKKLALRMTSVTGIGDLLPGVTVDDWAFEPCGYSMNGLRDRYYYTIHVTPESGFSYASFETNDPQYREPKWVERIASTFKPTALTLTLTTRRVGCELGAFVLGGYERSGLDTAELGKELSVCSMNFARNVEADVKEMKVGGPIKERRASKTGAPWWGS